MDKRTCQQILAHYRPLYRRTTKKGKAPILQSVMELTGYERKYASKQLRLRTTKTRVITRHRPSRYLPILVKLKSVWVYANCACGLRLKPMLPIYLSALVRHEGWVLTKKDWQLFGRISISTINRLLQPTRQHLALKTKRGTKPGTLLKSQIPIRMWTDWNEQRPGFLEIDSVHHGGVNPSGEYLYTLSTTDVYSGWHENQAHLGRSEKYTLKALQVIKDRLPFPLLGVDFDTGGEFVNWHLIRYCQKQQITYTRARAEQKNDQCYVEQQNWSVVRVYVGYGRFDTDSQLATLNQLYLHLSDYYNFFQAVSRYTEKVRDGARVRRKYQTKTPYQRLMHSQYITTPIKVALKKRYLSLNPKQLLSTINQLAKQLYISS